MTRDERMAKALRHDAVIDAMLALAAGGTYGPGPPTLADLWWAGPKPRAVAWVLDGPALLTVGGHFEGNGIATSPFTPWKWQRLSPWSDLLANTPLHEIVRGFAP